MADIQMPALGESVTEGTVTRWLKQVGDKVEVDEPLLEVSTDKVDTEIPSPVAGILQEILVNEDDTVEVGGRLAVIGEGNGAATTQQAPAVAETVAMTEQPATQVQQQHTSTEVTQPMSAPQAAQATQGDDSGAAGSGSTGGEAIVMPALGESVTEGTVTRWLKQVGDKVEVDEPLLEVSTDKVDTEIPSPVAGILQEILVNEDDTVEVGGRLALVGTGGGAPAKPSAPPATTPAAAPAETSAPPAQVSGTTPATTSASASAAAPATAPAPSTPAPTASADSAPASTSTRPATYLTPLVRQLAAKHGVDLSKVQGSGTGGRIRKQDVLDAAAATTPPTQAAAPASNAPAFAAPSAPAAAAPSAQVLAKRGSREKMSRLRKVIAQRMVDSLQNSAQLTTVVEVDVTNIANLRQQHKTEFERREGAKLSFLPFFAVAAVEALKAFPMINASIEGDEVVYHGSENLGLAVDTERGLLVPVIKDAGSLNLTGMAKRIADLANRTRSNQVTPDELAGSTFTLTNTGSRGALFDTPIINQPEVAILGTGAVVRRPVVITDGTGAEAMAIRSMVYLALSYDHRLVDGADAARFLTTIKARLESAAFEV